MIPSQRDPNNVLFLSFGLRAIVSGLLLLAELCLQTL
jgi:hypothetical protein